MATHSSTLAWRIPWTESLAGLQSMALAKSRTRRSMQALSCTYCAVNAHPVSTGCRERCSASRMEVKETQIYVYTQGCRRGGNPASSHRLKETSDVYALSSEDKGILAVGRLEAGRVRETAFEGGVQFALGKSTPRQRLCD